MVQVRNWTVLLEDGMVGRVRALVPPGYRDQDRISFPGLLELPAAPGTQTITDRWSIDWAR